MDRREFLKGALSLPMAAPLMSAQENLGSENAQQDSSKRSTLISNGKVYFKDHKYNFIEMNAHRDVIEVWPDVPSPHQSRQYEQSSILDIDILFYCHDPENFPYTTVGPEVIKEDIIIDMGSTAWKIGEFRVDGYEFVESDINRIFLRCNANAIVQSS